jgi:hypothetical protein
VPLDRAKTIFWAYRLHVFVPIAHAEVNDLITDLIPGMADQPSIIIASKVVMKRIPYRVTLPMWANPDKHPSGLHSCFDTAFFKNRQTDPGTPKAASQARHVKLEPPYDCANVSLNVIGYQPLV